MPAGPLGGMLWRRRWILGLGGMAGSALGLALSPATRDGLLGLVIGLAAGLLLAVVVERAQIADSNKEVSAEPYAASVFNWSDEKQAPQETAEIHPLQDAPLAVRPAMIARRQETPKMDLTEPGEIEPEERKGSQAEPVNAIRPWSPHESEPEQEELPKAERVDATRRWPRPESRPVRPVDRTQVSEDSLIAIRIREAVRRGRERAVEDTAGSPPVPAARSKARRAPTGRPKSKGTPKIDRVAEKPGPQEEPEYEDFWAMGREEK